MKTFSFIVSLLISTSVFAQISWLDNNQFSDAVSPRLDNQKVAGELSYILSAEVLPASDATGYAQLSNIRINGQTINATNFTGSVTLHLVDASSINTNTLIQNGYTVRFIKSSIGPIGGGGNPPSFKIQIFNPSGIQLTNIDDVTPSSSAVFTIEKTNATTLVFKVGSQIIHVESNAIQGDYRFAATTNTEGLSFNYGTNSFVTTATSYPDPAVVDTDRNFTAVKTYDPSGELTSASVAYFDELGRTQQAQTKDMLTKHTWAIQTFYDSQGRSAIATTSAPIGSNLNFAFKEDFVKNSFGNIYSNSDFDTPSKNELPSPISAEENTLGWYYSINNDREPYQDITNRPYVKTVYDELNPGAVRASVGGSTAQGSEHPGDLLTDFPQGFSYSMPAAQSLYYAFGKDYFPENQEGWFAAQGISGYNVTSGKMITHRAIKSVSIDPHGNEVVAFAGLEGNALAAARSGGTTKYPVISLIGPQGFVDIHMPKGTSYSDVTLLGNVDDYKIWNIRSGKALTNLASEMIGGNVYRIEYLPEAPDAIETITYITPNGIIGHRGAARGIRYKVNYYDFSLNYYDEANRLVESVQPLGFDNAAIQNGLNAVPNHGMKSINTYNALGQVVNASSPDEGSANFIYRTDGQIRFSQNTKQLSNNEFSYTNYDNYGRPVESGICIGNLPPVYTADSHITNPSQSSEQTFTLYDIDDQTTLDQVLNQTPAVREYKKQEWLSGNVSKTWNQNPATSTTWYSYDVYGRVTWMVQDVVGLGAKIIEYVYDDVTGVVNKVRYSEAGNSDKYVHRYSYNEIEQLVKVEVSNDDINFTEEASYEYYETGALKRTNISQGLQGVDYVYNISGALKSINHPSLEQSKDPGGDTDDMFGIIIDYHKRDYLRGGTNITGTTSGVDRYDGNIKATRWGTGNNDDAPITQHAYVYSYDKNLWLESATFGTPTPSGSITLHPQEDYKVSNLTYDPNGNILSLSRNRNTIPVTGGGTPQSNLMDAFSYNYQQGTNQLTHVTDNVSVTPADGNPDLTSQNAGNYIYNSIGQLVENVQDQIRYTYNTTGLVTKIESTDPAITQSIEFSYNDRNQRTRKRTIVNGETTDTYYVRDAAGQVMAIYNDVVTSTGLQTVKEYPIYGASRLGVQKGGNKRYELTDHLGNVRAVVQHPSAGGGSDGGGSEDPTEVIVFQDDFNDGTVAPWLGYPISQQPAPVIENGRLKMTLVPILQGIPGAYTPINLIAGHEYLISIFIKGTPAETFVGGIQTVNDTDNQTVSFNQQGTQTMTFTANETAVYNLYFAPQPSSNLPYLLSIDDVIIRDLTAEGNLPPDEDTTVIDELLLAYRDHFPFGMVMPDLNLEGDYRYAFQGQEKDPETGKEAFELRLWDARIGRWLTTDPAGQYNSPYLGMGNNPITQIDPDGAWHYDADGNLVSDGGDTIAGLSEFLGISSDFANEIAQGQGFIVDHNTGSGTGFFGGQMANGDFSIFRQNLPSNHISNGVDSHLVASFGAKQDLGALGGITNGGLALPQDFGSWDRVGSDGRQWVGCMACHGNNGAYRTLAYDSPSRYTGLSIAATFNLAYMPGQTTSLFIRNPKITRGVTNAGAPRVILQKGNITLDITEERVKMFVRNHRNPNARYGDQVNFKKYGVPEGSSIIKGAGKGHKRTPTTVELDWLYGN